MEELRECEVLGIYLREYEMVGRHGPLVVFSCMFSYLSLDIHHRVTHSHAYRVFEDFIRDLIGQEVVGAFEVVWDG